MIENLKKKVFHLFLGISLKRRLFITYLLLSSLILMLTSVFFYTASKKVLIKRAALSSQQQLSLITSNLGEKIDNISNYAITLSINSNIADVLKENPTVPENTLEHFLVNSELTDQAQRIIGLHKNIYAWDILDTENHWFHSSTTETDQLDSILGPEVLDSLQTNLAFQFLGPFQISGEPTFVALKSITNIDNTKYLGALVLLIRETNISSAFRDLPDSSSRDFYITDENGQILSSSSSGGIYKDFSSYTKISSENYKTLTETDRQFFSVDGTDTLFICKSYPDLNWNVINLIPLESLTLDHMVILHNILLISIVVFILSVFFSILCTGTVTAPIQKLVEKMKSASAGKLNISASYSSNDELAVLYNQFNLMMQKIQTLLNDIYEEQNAKQKMEVRLLQSQINPHFLYNTLNTIKSLIELDMNDTAVKAVSSMSSFYRNSLSKGQFIIPLRQELLLTEQYLYIQNLRYMDFVDYEITYDGDLINAGTVKLTVTGIGAYTGSVETTYNIQKLSMSNASFSVAPAYYTGSEVTPEVTVTHSGKTLVKDRDFIVTYHNNIEPSSYYNSPWVGIDGIGNYQGYVTKSFTINRADISSCTVTLSDESLTYTGSSLRPTVTVKNGDKELTLNQDYYVSYRNNWNAGTASVIVNGSGNYTGSVTKDFQIIPADISNYEVTLYNDSFDYDGTAKEQRYVRLYSGTRWLSEDTDFTVTYANNVNAGTASAILTGTGNYTGSVTKDFTIKPLDISRYSASLSQYSYTSDGTEKCPDVTVTYGDKTLAAGTDFTVSYKDNVKEGTATVTITGAGNYTGIINTTFTITAAPGKDDSDSGKDNPSKDDSGKDDSGKDNSVKDDSGKDNSGKDDSGKDNSSKNDSDKGNQNSSTPGNNNNNNNNGNTSGNNDQNNNGQNNNNTNNNSNNQNNSSNNEANNDTAITPVPAVINASDITLTKSKKKANIITSIESDGKVSLKSSNTKVVKISGTKVIPVNPGKANVTITVAAGTRYAAASKTVTITVIPAKTSLRSVKSKTAKQATVTWKKAKSISGYQISYSQNSSMKKAKTLTVKGSATRATLKKLVSKKKYYVRIRTYKVISGKKYYSKWSSKKSVKIK